MADKHLSIAKKINDFDIGDNITSYFSVRSKQVREYYKGQYVKLEIGDSSGRITAMIWEPDQFSLTELDAGMIIKAQGIVGEYQNKPQFTVNQIRVAKEDEYEIEDILPHSTQSDEERTARILSLTEKVENSYVKQLINSFWEDEEFMSRYLKSAAAKLWHHAYVGGLSEHSANVAELALRVARGYDFLNTDYLIFGGLFHDAGKIDTYKADASIDFTDEGRLVNHICIADAWIAQRAATIENFPEKLLMKLRHMVLAHQGELEYASPVVPQMPEAFVLYYCDEIDSKMGALGRIRERMKEPGWSDYVNLLNRFLYFESIPEEETDTDE